MTRGLPVRVGDTVVWFNEFGRPRPAIVVGTHESTAREQHFPQLEPELVSLRVISLVRGDRNVGSELVTKPTPEYFMTKPAYDAWCERNGGEPS